MICLSFRDKTKMLLHSIMNPAGIITLVMFTGTLIGTILNFNVMLLIITISLFVIFDILTYDMPRTLLFIREAHVLPVSNIRREVPKDVGYRRNTSHDIPNWDAKGLHNEKIRMVYHSKKPPVSVGDKIIVIKGFRGKYYGFKDVR